MKLLYLGYPTWAGEGHTKIITVRVIAEKRHFFGLLLSFQMAWRSNTVCLCYSVVSLELHLLPACNPSNFSGLPQFRSIQNIHERKGLEEATSMILQLQPDDVRFSSPEFWRQNILPKKNIHGWPTYPHVRYPHDE